MPHARTQTPHANPASIPSIRLIAATPSAAGSSEGSSFEFNRSLEDAWAAIASTHPPAPLAPKSEPAADAPRKKLVPKKSKLSLLAGLGGGKERERARDFSDVVRRVGADCSAKGGFEIYVDPEVGAESGEVLVVKKRKSRAALDGMSWGAREVTNVPKTAPPKEKEAKDKGLLKVKAEEGQKWWSIGRGRKDSKEKENKISHKPIEYIHDPHPRSKTPEPFRPTDNARARFNSLDASAVLNGPVATHPVKFDEPREPSRAPTPAQNRATTPTPTLARSITPTLTRSITPTAGGLLAPPNGQNQAQGSIALRAMRSVRSLARIGSWAQLKNMPAPGADDEMEGIQEAAETSKKERRGTVKEKKEKKDKKEKKEKTKESTSASEDGKKKKKSLKAKKDKTADQEKAQSTLRLSSSSFEAGALTASPGPAPAAHSQARLGVDNAQTLGAKKRSILGLGLPSTMRLPSLGARTLSSASAVSSASSAANVFPPAISAPQRLSAGSFSSNGSHGSTTGTGSGSGVRQLIIAGAQGQTRRGSLVSTASAGSSLRPLSTTSTRSSLSAGSGEGGRAASVRSGSVRWDEEGLETVRERRGAERAAARKAEEEKEKEERKERRTSKESRHSAEGRKRTSLKAVFGELALEATEGEEKEAETASHKRQSFPILTIEEATADGHAPPSDELFSEDGSAEGMEEEQIAATPVKKARARPLSEQMLGKSRPRPMHEDDEGVLSILDAATNDLALLINNLDLQATPSTPGDCTPLRTPLSPDFTPTGALASASAQFASQSKARVVASDSPLKSAKKAAAQLATMSSVSSLRPYAQSRGYVKSKPVSPITAPLLPAAPIVSASTTAKSAGNANANTNAARIAQQIAPWATLVQGLSPVKETVRALNAKAQLSVSASSVSSTATFRPGHKRTMTPAREPDPEPVFQPLRPARSRLILPRAMMEQAPAPSPVEEDPTDDDMLLDDLAPLQSTFGRASGALTPVFKRIMEDEQVRSGLRAPASGEREGSLRSSRGSRLSAGSYLSVQSRRSGGSRRSYGPPSRAGTLGGSDASVFDAEDPDSDVPDELRDILAQDTRSSYGGVASFDEEDDEVAMIVDLRAAPSPPPNMPLPTIYASLAGSPGRSESDGFTHSDLEGEDSTKASFDWTGALNELNESGASDRRSFVEQLEHAFKTPAKVDLRYDFLSVPSLAPPVPRLPTSIQAQKAVAVHELEVGRAAAAVTEDWRMAVAAETSTSSMGDEEGEMEMEYEYDSGALNGVVDRDEGGEASSGMEMDGWGSERLADVQMPSALARSEPSTSVPREVESRSRSDFDMFAADGDERLADVRELTMGDLGHATDENDISFARSTSSAGELDTSFRFGGLPQSLRKEAGATKPTDAQKEKEPMTLSDIIPPPAHARRLSQSFDSSGFSDSALFEDIYERLMHPTSVHLAAAAAATVPVSVPITGVNAEKEKEAKRRSIYKAHSRPTSGISFAGLGDSFEAVRRGFEFSNERPAFYPPPSRGRGSRQARHNKMESMATIASMSSVGSLQVFGSSDPFEYGVPVMPSLSERPSSENMSAMFSGSEFEDTFAFRRGVDYAQEAPGSLRYVGGRPRQRVESDASTFSFHAPLLPTTRGHHRRRESNMSVASLAPPISMYNRAHGHGHRRNDSTASTGSVAYARSSGTHAYVRHRRDMSDASMGSEFSAGYSYLGRPGVGDKMFGDRYERPGVGDKMFEMGGMELGPLTSITASPPESAVRRSFASSADGESAYAASSESGEEVPLQSYSSSMLAYDSILSNGPDRRFEDSDSIFEKTGYGPQRDSLGSDEVFGDYPKDSEKHVLDEAGNRLHAPLIKSHRWSVHTMDNTGVFGSDNTGAVSPSKVNEEDTMLSMLGGGHAAIRRQSILESPCPRVEKRKFSAVQGLRLFKGKAIEQYESPAKARIVEKASLASASSFQFGSDRMIKAQRGLLERQSLEDSCLIADGEELINAYFNTAPVFTRPNPTTRSRSSTCTSSSTGSVSGADTPPLSSSTGGETPPLLHHSDASSISEGSQSSIDLSQINIALANATSPMSSMLNRSRIRARARGSGHRRRYSNVQRMSRSSVYETIDEDAELASTQGHDSPDMTVASKKSTPTTRQAVFVVDSDTASFDGHAQPEESMWSDERGIVALRKYYALRDEAHTTVTESRRQWSDTPFSLFAIQGFQAPAEPAGMQALLEYSVQNFGPLPSELRPHRVRSRTSSRASPYPQARIAKATQSPEKTRSAKATLSPEPVRRVKKSTAGSERTPVLRQRSMNHNLAAAPSLEVIKPFSPLVMDIEPKRENAFGLAPNARPRVASNARRTALGWSKRSTGKSSTDQKENQVATGTITTPGDNLRLNRPRPRGRPTPGGRTPVAQSQSRPIRV